MLKKLLLLGLKLLRREVVEKPLIDEVVPDMYSYVITRRGEGSRDGQVLDRSVRSTYNAQQWDLVIANRLMIATSELRGYLSQSERYYEFNVEIKLLYPTNGSPIEFRPNLDRVGKQFEKVDPRWRYEIQGNTIRLAFVEAPEIEMGHVIRVA